MVRTGRRLDAVVNLMGNHEQMMLAAVSGSPSRTRRPTGWPTVGADSLMSWGIGRAVPHGRMGQSAATPAPDLSARSGNQPPGIGPYMFVHAGIRAQRAAGQSSPGTTCCGSENLF